MISIEQFWDALLSRGPENIQKTYKHLSMDERKAVNNHLITMTTENGWSIIQKHSEQIALDSIKGL